MRLGVSIYAADHLCKGLMGLYQGFLERRRLGFWWALDTGGTRTYCCGMHSNSLLVNPRFGIESRAEKNHGGLLEIRGTSCIVICRIRILLSYILMYLWIVDMYICTHKYEDIYLYASYMYTCMSMYCMCTHQSLHPELSKHREPRFSGNPRQGFNRSCSRVAHPCAS